MLSLFRYITNRVETKLGVNFKHRTILFVYTDTNLTRKKKWQANRKWEYNNNKSRKLGKKIRKHNKHDSQKIHQDDKVEIE